MTFSHGYPGNKEVRLNIHISNMSLDVTENDLRQVFEGFGKVESVRIVQEIYTRRSKGIGFVEMPIEAEAEAAITGMNGKELKGQALQVSKA